MKASEFIKEAFFSNKERDEFIFAYNNLMYYFSTLPNKTTETGYRKSDYNDIIEKEVWNKKGKYADRLVMLKKIIQAYEEKTGIANSTNPLLDHDIYVKKVAEMYDKVKDIWMKIMIKYEDMIWPENPDVDERRGLTYDKDTGEFTNDVAFKMFFDRHSACLQAIDKIDKSNGPYQERLSQIANIINNYQQNPW